MQAMTYIIGAMQIEKLRDDWLTSNPSKSIKDFHNEFLSMGPIAPELLRRIMIK